MYQVSIRNGDVETLIHSPYFSDLKIQEGQIKQDINIADGFTFTILPNNTGYNLIRPLSTLINVFDVKKQKYEFEGRILMPMESMSDQGIFSKSFICESEMAYLNDSSQRHGEYHNISVRDFLQVIIDNHNRDIADDPIDKRFELGIVDVDSPTGELYRYLGYENTFDTIKDKLIDRLGGEIRVRKENGIRYLDYVKEIGEVKETEIRLSKNLKSITKEVDPTELITHLIPLGERIESEDEDATDASEARLTIESVNGGKDYLVDEQALKVAGTIIYGRETWDDITQPNILKTRGQQHLRDHNRIKKQHQLTALDLHLIGLDSDSFELGNYYPVINHVMRIDEHLRIVAKTIDIIDPKNNDLSIGDKFLKASDYQREAIQAHAKIIDLESAAERQNKRYREQSQALKQAQEELETVRAMVENIDAENIEETLALITQQLFDITATLNEIGYEITDLELRTILLEDFRVTQEHLNHQQELINEDVLERLEKLENPEGDN